MINLDLLYTFIRFGIVGLSGVGVDFGTTWLGKEKLRLNKYIANAIGFCTAATTNYFLNRWWTFHSSNPEIIHEYFRFFLVSALGLGINTLVIWFLINTFKFRFYSSKLIAIGVVMLWNFFANLLFTFA
jgi:putative flippase GtrA